MGRRDLRRHIWVYSVCICPIKGTPGLNELSRQIINEGHKCSDTKTIQVAKTDITKTLPSDIQRLFSAVKIEKFIGKILIFLTCNVNRGGSSEYPQSMF